MFHPICFDAAGNPVPPAGVDAELWNLELPSILGIAWRGEYPGDEAEEVSVDCGASDISDVGSSVDSVAEPSSHMHAHGEHALHRASAEGIIYGHGHVPSIQRWSLPDDNHVYVLEVRPLPAVCPPTHPAELLAYRILHSGSIHVGQFMQLMLQLPEPGSKKRKCAQESTDHERQFSFSVGAFKLGGLHGVLKATRSFPWVARLLVAVVRGSCFNHVFSAIGLHLNTRMTPHVDIHNSPSRPNLLLPCSRWRGGGLWVSNATHLRTLCDASSTGYVVDITPPYVLMDPHRLHATMEWNVADDRLLLVAYAVDRPSQLTAEDSEMLEDLGFSVRY